MVDSRWPNTAYKVVTQNAQFECNAGDMNRNWESFKKRCGVNGGDWMRASRAWETSAKTNTTDNAHLYHGKHIKPNWDWSKCRETLRYKGHIFYEELR